MAQFTTIGWTIRTLNLWWGCVKITIGCDKCFASAGSIRWGYDIWGNDRPRRQIKSAWTDLLKFQKIAKAANTLHRVFVGSMMDIFENPMPLIDNDGNPLPHNTGDLRQQFFDNITNGMYPNWIIRG